MNKKHINYKLRVIALPKFPIDYSYVCLYDNETKNIYRIIRDQIEYCEIENLTENVTYNSTIEVPFSLYASWYSALELKKYELSLHKLVLMDDLFIREDIIKNGIEIVIGIGLYGNFIMWLKYHDICKVYLRMQGKIIDSSNIFPNDKYLSESEYYKARVIDNFCVEKNNGIVVMPSIQSYIKYIQEFSYRLLIDHKEVADSNSIIHNDSVSFVCYNGFYLKSETDFMMKYIKIGKPKKMSINWRTKKTEYTAYFWFEYEIISLIFEKFYGAHPDTKTDFIIRIDAERKKYELALYRQGLKEPQIIPEEAYQLLVFKNKFEDYRSDNYNQERGAWIW